MFGTTATTATPVFSAPSSLFSGSKLSETPQIPPSLFTKPPEKIDLAPVKPSVEVKETKADEKQVEKEAPSLFTKPPVTTSLFGATPQGSLFTA